MDEDNALVHRALRDGWEVPPSKRRAVVDRLTGIVEAETSKPRERISASRALIQIAKCEAEQLVRDQAELLDELLARLAALEARIREYEGEQAVAPGPAE